MVEEELAKAEVEEELAAAADMVEQEMAAAEAALAAGSEMEDPNTEAEEELVALSAETDAKMQFWGACIQAALATGQGMKELHNVAEEELAALYVEADVAAVAEILAGLHRCVKARKVCEQASTSLDEAIQQLKMKIAKCEQEAKKWIAKQSTQPTAKARAMQQLKMKKGYEEMLNRLVSTQVTLKKSCGSSGQGQL